MKSLSAYPRVVVSPLVSFSLVIFFITLSDGVLSYFVPIHLENKFGDAFIVGAVLSVSSFFGMFFDFFVAEKLAQKTYHFFIFWTLIFATFFAILLLAPAWLPLLVFAMVAWSVYYELRDFSKYDFIHRFLTIDKHTYAWSVMVTLQSIAYALGPAVAVLIIDIKDNLVMVFSLLCVFLAAVVYKIFILKLDKKSHGVLRGRDVKRSFGVELKIVYILFKKVWLLFFVDIALTILDVSFWTTGILFAEDLRQSHPQGGLFMVIYGLPALIIGLIAPFFSKFGKKRAGFLTALLSGLVLVLLYATSEIYTLLGSVFLVSFLSGISVILMSSVYEDYVARLSIAGNDIVTIKQFGGNFAYAVGPIVLGFLGEKYGLKFPFLVSGISIVVASLLALIFVPKKIRMPQKELSGVLVPTQ